jgi:hypothetical protein
MGTTTKDRAKRDDDTKVTLGFNGQSVETTTGALRELAESSVLRLQEADVVILRTAGEMAKKAGDAAAKACEKAELAMEAAVALSLAGYAEEAVLYIDKRVRGVVALPTNHRRALATGCRLMLAECEKIREKQEVLVIGTDETNQRAREISHVLRNLLKAPVQRELGDPDDEENGDDEAGE